MTSPGASGREALEQATRIPIAQLSPELSGPDSKAFKAVVTLIWPYSSIKGSLEVLLAEPDFRLRRTRGQVRVQFSGAIAKAVVDSKVGSGDEILISLLGAEWIKDDSIAQTPGRGIEWELKYGQKLLLQVKENETGVLSFLDLDHPSIPSDSAPVFPTPELLSPVRPAPPTFSRPDLVRSETAELSSPAFIKRARVSYGSLLDSGYDIFGENDGSIEGKGRKRAKLGRESGFRRSSGTSWRVSSRSPSPEIEVIDDDQARSPSPEPTEEPVNNTKPTMMDEGSQTIDESASEMLPPPPRLVVAAQDAGLPNTNSYFREGGYRAPLSPRLQPLSSDSLPLVSPIGDRAFMSYFGDGERNVAHSMQTQTSPWHKPGDLSEIAGTDEPEDLYNASPPGNLNQQISSFGETFGQSIPSINYDSIQDMMNAPPPELSDQYGHWQMITATQESDERDAEHGDNSKPRQHGEHLSDVNENMQPIADIEGTRLAPQQTYSYPEPDQDKISELRQPQGWGSDVTSALYPHLPLNEDKITRMGGSPQIRGAGAIDITEDHYEEERREALPDMAIESYADERSSSPGHFDNVFREAQLYPGQIVEEYRKAEEVHEEWEPRADDNNRHRHNSVTYEPEYGNEYNGEGDIHPTQTFTEAQTEDDFESGDEAEGEPFDDEHHESIHGTRDHDHQRMLAEDGEYYEGSEEGLNDQEYESEEEYDSQSEEDEQPQISRVPPGPPEIIDLLSDSDDEPVAAEPIKSPASSTFLNQRRRAPDERTAQNDSDVEEEDSEDSEDGEAMGVAAEPPELGSDIDVADADSAVNNREDDEDEDEDDDEADGEDGSIEQNRVGVVSQEYISESSDEEQLEVAQQLIVEANGLHPLDSVDRMDSSAAFMRQTLHYSSLDGAADAYDDVEEEAAHPGDSVEASRTSQVDDMLYSSTAMPDTETVAPTSEKAQNVDAILIDSNTKVSTGSEAAVGKSAVTDTLEDPDNEIAITDTDEVLGQQVVLQARSEDIAYPVLPSIAESVNEAAMTVEDNDRLAIAHEKIGNAQLMTPDATQVAEQFAIEGMDKAPADTQGAYSSASQRIGHSPDNNARTERPVPKSSARVTRSTSVQIQETPNTQENSSAKERVESTPEPRKASISISPASRRVTRSKASVQQESANGIRKSPPATLQLNTRGSQITTEVEPPVPARITRAAAQKALREVSLPPPTTPKQLGSTARDGSVVQSSPMIPSGSATPGYDASAELAMSTLESPTSSTNDTPAALRARLMKSLRVNVPYATALKVLRFNIGKNIDALAVATTLSPAPEKAKDGPRHHHLRFNVTDPSIAPSAVTEIQIFRPYKEALPSVEPGDGILLRGFIIKSEKGKNFVLRSGDESSWVVFKKDGSREVRGPPVEFGNEEISHIANLRTWFERLDELSMAKLERANGVKEKGKSASKTGAK